MSVFAAWLDNTPVLLIGFVMVLTLVLASLCGTWMRRRQTRESPDAQNDDHGRMEGYVVSAALALLGLLLAFTFAMSVERFETRRALVLQEANAIGTAYLRSQALNEPHRSRMSKVLVDYTNNRIALATTARADRRRLLAINDRLLTELWSATLAANDTIKTSPFTVAFLAPINQVIELDASRKAARLVRVPSEVFLVLWTYLVVTAGIVGYIRAKMRGKELAGVLSVLVTMAFMLILDIDRPVEGGVTEGQGPMLQLREMLNKEPPGTFDRWRQP